MVCLETTFLIDLLRGKNSIRELKDEIDKGKEQVTITSISVMEIWAGANFSRSSPKEKEKINDLLAGHEILDFDIRAAKEAGEIEAELMSKGTPIDIEDVMIAAIAKVNGEKLVTRDNHYGSISGLRVLKY